MGVCCSRPPIEGDQPQALPGREGPGPDKTLHTADSISSNKSSSPIRVKAGLSDSPSFKVQPGNGRSSLFKASPVKTTSPVKGQSSPKRSAKVMPSEESESTDEITSVPSEQFTAAFSPSAVKVAVAVRPMLEFESLKGATDCLKLKPPHLVTLPPLRGGTEEYRFEYDRVYDMVETRGDDALFGELVAPLVARVLQGFNATVLAYGQTGSGKTYSMGSTADPQQLNGRSKPYGVIPRALVTLFEGLQQLQADYDVATKVTFVEIYQDDIRDLLRTPAETAAGFQPQARMVLGSTETLPKERGINIRENSEGTFLDGVREMPVRSAMDAMTLLQRGNSIRVVGAHNMNERSSRSHVIYTIQLNMRKKSQPRSSGRPTSGPAFLRSKLHLIDLAGSERQKDTGATGQSFSEGIQINKGLLALGNVIGALTEGKGRKHVPYRDSKLTRILQDSLGGNSETLMVACVTPSSLSQEHTIGTLRYASRARSIKNQLRRNDQDLKAAMTSALSTIHLLPCTIQHNGVANVNEYFLTSHIDQAGSNILEATLRGRQLYGAQLPVPPGYECHVLERQQQPPQHTGEAPASWQSTASASSITYWKHDIHPAKTDDIPRCYEWLKLSEQIAADVPWQEVEAAVHTSQEPAATLP
ncbi:hypothetical protein WJX84_002323 [Apatococcus fuscideae]|uniref:Kinesin-like protein n=1 Tax=Apatococcus fuscideae TaxID=2026836 RepID=A0AAW1SQD6_9CHLO